MIEAIELTSRGRGRSGAGRRPVVDHVSFDVYPGPVTALLGAPGVGKSSVLRMMTQQEPAKGRTLFGGRPYRALRPAVREVGLALDPDALHPGRTVRAHLALYGAAGGVPRSRVGEVLEIGGLTLQAHSRCGELDAAQRQRLSIAAALLGDPAALIIDEPYRLEAHGLAWFHALIRAYAAQGRTVLVAASDPAILAGAADHVVVLRRDEADGRTRVIASRSAAEVFDEHRATVVIVRSPQAARLAAALEAQGATLSGAGPGALEVRGLDRARIGEIAHTAGICIHELAETGCDDTLYGIELPRKAIDPAPIEMADAEDDAVGVTAGPRTGWRSGVRLVGSAGGTATIQEAEVVEPREGSETDTASGSGAPAVDGASGSGALAVDGASGSGAPAVDGASGSGAPAVDGGSGLLAFDGGSGTAEVAGGSGPVAQSKSSLAGPTEVGTSSARGSDASSTMLNVDVTSATPEPAAPTSRAVHGSGAAVTPRAAHIPGASYSAYAAELAAAYAQAFAEDAAAGAGSLGPYTAPSTSSTQNTASTPNTASTRNTPSPENTPSPLTTRTPEEASA